MKRLQRSLKWKVIIFISVVIITLLLTLNFVILNKYETNLYSEKKIKLQSLMDTTMKILKYYHSLEEEGKLTTTQAQAKAKNQLKLILYGANNKDYFWIIDHEPRMIMHPFKPDFEGKNISDIKDEAGNYLFNKMVKIVERKNEGFIKYYWQYYDNKNRVEPKLSFVKEFNTWDWIVGTGIYINDINEQLTKVRNQLILISFIITGFSLIIVFYFTQKISDSLAAIASQARLISEGNLNSKIPSKCLERKDEIGVLGIAFEKMRSNLKQKIEKETNIAIKLKRLNQKLENIFEFKNMVFWSIDVDDFTMMDMSGSYQKLYGYDDHDFCNNPFLLQKVVHSEDKKRIKKEKNKIFSEDSPDVIKLQYKIRRKDGMIRWVQEITIPVKNQDDELKRIDGLIFDITERKKLENEILESKNYFNSIISANPDIIMLLNINGDYLDIWTSQSKDLVASEDELVGNNISDFLPEDVMKKWRQHSKLAVKNDQVQSFEYKLDFDGEVKFFEAYMVSMNDNKIIANIRNITERKQIENELKKHLEAMEASIDGIAILNKEQEYVYLNQAHAEIYGYDSTDELIGKSWRILYDEDELKRFEQEIMPRFIQKGHWRGRAVGKKKDGRKFPQEISLTALDNGGLICVVRDITEQEQIEEELKTSKERLNTLISETPAIIFSYKLGEIPDITYISQNIKNVLGFEPETFVNNFEMWQKHIHPDDIDIVQEGRKTLLKQGEVTCEYRFKAKGGDYCWLHDSQKLIKYEDGTKEVIGAWWDITKNKKREEEVKYLSFHDQMTGLYNRRYFEQEVDRLNQSRKLPVSIIVADIDNLKKVNDNFGHKKGDKYIKISADIISSVTRKADIVARIGGDEFAVILPETKEKAANNIVKRILKKCENEYGINDNVDLQIPVSISVGAATKKHDNEDLNKIFKQADKAMYEMKNSNR